MPKWKRGTKRTLKMLRWQREHSSRGTESNVVVRHYCESIYLRLFYFLKAAGHFVLPPETLKYMSQWKHTCKGESAVVNSEHFGQWVPKSKKYDSAWGKNFLCSLNWNMYFLSGLRVWVDLVVENEGVLTLQIFVTIFYDVLATRLIG